MNTTPNTTPVAPISALYPGEETCDSCSFPARPNGRTGEIHAYYVTTAAYGHAVGAEWSLCDDCASDPDTAEMVTRADEMTFVTLPGDKGTTLARRPIVSDKR